MTNSASEIVIGANGSINVAPLGSTLPTDPTTAYDAAFAQLGFATEAGVKIHDAKTMNLVKVWQSFYPARRNITERDFTVTFGLVQWNKNTVPFAFGGGAITSPSAGVFEYTPPDPSLIDERVVGIDWQDGSKNYRLLIPRCVVQDAVDSEITRTKESELPIVVGVTSDGTLDPWVMLTDDPSWS